MSTTQPRTVTVRPVGDGTVLLKAWKGADGYPIYLEEKEGMTPEQKKRVVRNKATGLPVGKRELTGAWAINTEETDLINAIKQHPFCNANPKCAKPQILLIDHYADMEKEEQLAEKGFKLQEAILKLSDIEVKGLCTVLGIEFNQKSLSSIKSKIQRDFNVDSRTMDNFFNYFDIEENNSGIKSITLKDAFKMQALVIAALKQGVLKSEQGTGTIVFKNEVIGLNIQDAALNLLNSADNGKGNFLPLIKQGLSGKK